MSKGRDGLWTLRDTDTMITQVAISDTLIYGLYQNEGRNARGDFVLQTVLASQATRLVGHKSTWRWHRKGIAIPEKVRYNSTIQYQ